MNREAFLKTAIETLKYDSKFKKIKDRELLIRMLGRAKTNFVPQYAFSSHGRDYQHWEIVELRFPVPLIDEANNHISELEEISEYVYEESEEFALQSVEIRPLVVDAPEEIKEHDVVFNEIQDTVIQGIRDAKFLIWAAVAWFTNEAIFQELLVKKDHGLNIRIIVSQEETNTAMIAKLEKQNFDIKVVDRWGVKNYNRMHDKFCIIDLDYVMHGSYNWTPTANFNHETLATAIDHELVSKFAESFIKLYTL